MDKLKRQTELSPYKNVLDQNSMDDSTNNPFLARLFQSLEQPDTTDPRIPRRIRTRSYIRGRKRVGQGGLGIVYEYFDKRLDRKIALKVARKKVLDSESRLQRFLREREVTARLQHPAIPPVFQCGELGDGRPYYLMRLINGESFAKRIQTVYADAPPGQNPSDERLGELLDSFLEACDAVQYAHDQHVIHRDIKPANMMVEPDGTTFLVDWGLARDDTHRVPESLSLDQLQDENEAIGIALTQDGQQLGSLDWMSPEQASGNSGAHTKQTDIYGLGATLFHIITGRAPHSVSPEQHDLSLKDRIERITSEDTPQAQDARSDVSPELASICNRAMSFDPRDRYQSAAELKKDVQRWQRREVVDAHRSHYSTLQKVELFSSRHRRILSVTVIALFLLLTGAGYANVQISEAADTTQKALDDQRQANEQLFTSLEQFTDMVMQDEVLATPQLQTLRDRLLTDLANQYRIWSEQKKGTSEELARAAKGTIRLAKIEQETGNLARAIDSCQRAVELANISVASADPQNRPQRLQLVINATREQALLAILAGKLDLADSLIKSIETQHTNHLNLLTDSERLNESSAIDKLKMSLAYQQAERATSSESRLKLMEISLSHAQNTVSAQQKLLNQNSQIDTALELVAAQNGEALTLHKLARKQEAIKVYREALAILKARDQENLPDQVVTRIRRLQIVMLFNAIMTYRGENDFEGVTQVATEGINICKDMKKRHPLVIRYSEELARGYGNYAEALWIKYLVHGQSKMDLDQAINTFRSAGEEYSTLLMHYPERTGYAGGAAIQYLRLSYALHAAGRDVEALTAFQKCLSFSHHPEDLEPLHGTNAFMVLTGYCLVCQDKTPNAPHQHPATQNFKKLLDIIVPQFHDPQSRYVYQFANDPLYRQFDTIPIIAEALKSMEKVLQP